MPAPVWPCCHLSTLIRGILLLRRDSLALPRQQARSREPTKKGCREERLNIRSNRLRYHHSRAGSARSRHPTASRRYETLILGPRSTLEWLPPPAAPHSSLQLANAIYKYTLFININIIKSVFGPKKTKNIPLLIWSSFLETHVQ